MNNPQPAVVVGHVTRSIADGFERDVECWLSQQVTGFVGARIQSVKTSTSGGLSGETYIITLDSSQSSNAAAWTTTQTIVLKKNVADKQTNPQTNFSNLVVAQTALGNIAGLRVPRVLGYEPSRQLLGAQFIVMEFVEGEIPADVPSYAASGWVHDATDQQRAALWQSGIEFLVRLHQLDWRELGLGQLQLASSGADDLEKTLNYSIDLFRLEAGGQSSPIIERAIAWLRANRPLPDRSCVCWGDARIGNIIWQKFKPIAFIDWDMSTIACPGVDLGWWSFFHRWSTFGQGHPDLGGMCVGQPLANLYQACGGSHIENLCYYEILATVKGLSVWLRMYRLMRADGKLPEMNPLDDNIHMVRVLRLLMDQAD